MNAHSGNVLSVANAQNGIFLRAFAAATTGMSGLGGGGPTGCAGPADGVRTAGADDVVAGVVPGDGASPSADGVPPSDAGLPPSACARAALLRFSRCSGISVTDAHDRRRDAEMRKSS